MTVDVKVGALGGGSWRRIANGSIRAKKPPWELDAGTWFVPTKCYAKIGALGGGIWRDTGYESNPFPPSMPWVQQWNYSQTLTGFSGPNGGPPIDYYHIERLDQNGTPVEGYYDTSGSRWWNTPQDSRHQFRVRSHGANGLWSAWVGNLRVGIGHPSTPNYGYVQRYRAWTAAGFINGQGYRDNIAGHYVPNGVHVESVHWQMNCRDYFHWILSTAPGFVQGGDRQIYIIQNDTQMDGYGVMEWPSPLDGWDNFDYWGNGTRTGFICRGGGWYGNRQADGHITVNGTEVYNNYEIVSYNPEQGNYYW